MTKPATLPVVDLSTSRDDGAISTVRCEKLGPMHWRIHAPGRAAFDYWSYALEAHGVTYTETFTAALGCTHPGSQHGDPMPTPKRDRPDRRPTSHLVAAVPISRPEIEQEACQACGGDCTVVREGTPRFGAWSWLRCLRCAWHDRPAVDANGDGVHGAEF